MVLRISPVLVGEQDVKEARIDVGARRRQSPTPLRRGVGAQQPTIAIDDERRIGKALSTRRRAKGDDPPTCERGEQHSSGRKRNCKPRDAKARAPRFPPPMWGRDRGGGVALSATS